MNYTTTIKKLHDFYEEFPECKGKVLVNSRFGYLPVDEVGVTVRNEQVLKILTEKGRLLSGSKNHMLLSDDGWKKIKDFNPNDIIHTIDGVDIVSDVVVTKSYMDMYDLQVRKHKEFYANGIVSHNSTIVDSLYFTLFGKTIRELKNNFIVNSINKKNCEVILWLDVETETAKDEYKITRKLSPSKCILERNGVDETKSTIDATSAFIQKLVNSSGAVFKNSVIMTINDTVPFLAQEKIDKRKFIENVVNLEVFSAMLKSARDEYNELRREYENLYTKKDTLQQSYELNKQQMDLFESNKQKRITDVNTKIKLAEESVEVLRKQFIKVDAGFDVLIKNKKKDFNTELQQIETDYRKIVEEVSDVKSEMRQISSQISSLSQKSSSCPTCKRPYENDDTEGREQLKKDLSGKLLEFQEQEKEVNKKFTPLNEKKTDITAKIKKLDDALLDITNKINANDKLTSKIDYNVETIESYKKDIIKIEAESNAILEKTVKDTEVSLEKYKLDLADMDKRLNILDCIKFVVSEEGVKSYIIKKILTILNKKMAYYLQKFEANCICRFNELFEEEVIDERQEPKSYFNFSGGERKRIDLACLFSFLDIRRMQGDVSFSATFYDELLDSSLDDRGVELVLEVLRDRVDQFKENAYIITHRGAAITSKVDNSICIEKKNGFSNLAKV